MISAVWLGIAVLYLYLHRFGPLATLLTVCGVLVLGVLIRYRILPLGPIEGWYDEYRHRRRIARLSRLAREEQIAADPVNNEILYVQQFASPGLMLLLTPEEFFDLVLHYFRLLGYARRYQRVELGGPTDAILRRGNDWYLLRCLRLERGQVEEAELRSLAITMDENLCLLGILVTNQTFTPEAEKAARELQITLLDGQTLAGSIQAFQLRDPTAPSRPTRRPG